METTEIADMLFRTSARLDSSGDHAQEQEAIATCMKAAGFEYVPIPFEMQPETFLASGDTSFVETNGYGMVATARDRFKGIPPGNDPNDEIVGAMTDAERSEWIQQLQGPGNCREQAFEQVYGLRNSISEQFADRYEEVGRRIESDKRLVEVIDRWSECMAERGYVYANPAIPPFEVSQELNLIESEAPLVEDPERGQPTIEVDDAVLRVS